MQKISIVKNQVSCAHVYVFNNSDKEEENKANYHHHVNLHVKTDCSLEVASKLFVTKCICLDKSLILRMCLVDNKMLRKVALRL